MDNIKILIVDDDADDYLLTCAHLGDISDKKFDIHWAANYVQGLAKINSIKPDICLFDFILGAKTGLNLLDDIRQSGNDVPVILLTGKGDTAIDRAAMTLGATDYLVKSDLNHTLLERSIRYALAHTANLRAVRTSEQLYRTIFEKSKNMIFLIDATSGRFSEVSPFGCALFGYDRDTFLNKLTARDLFPNAEIDRKSVV